MCHWRRSVEVFNSDDPLWRLGTGQSRYHIVQISLARFSQSISITIPLWQQYSLNMLTKEAGELLKVFCRFGSAFCERGMGEVIGSLPAALRQLGMECRVILPKYRLIPGIEAEYTIYKTHICKLGWRYQYCGIESEYNGVPCYLSITLLFWTGCSLWIRGRRSGDAMLFCRGILDSLIHTGMPKCNTLP